MITDPFREALGDRPSTGLALDCRAAAASVVQRHGTMGEPRLVLLHEGRTGAASELGYVYLQDFGAFPGTAKGRVLARLLGLIQGDAPVAEACLVLEAWSVSSQDHVPGVQPKDNPKRKDVALVYHARPGHPVETWQAVLECDDSGAKLGDWQRANSSGPLVDGLAAGIAPRMVH